ncbi:hypothetical protein ACLKA7_008198 [Drosophila subpalustris]
MSVIVQKQQQQQQQQILKQVQEQSKVQRQRDNKKRITLEGGAEPPWLQGPLKAAFLGATGVGKTSILQQFFYHDFPKTHQTTTHRKIYKNCLVCDACIRELMVLDVPPQKRFPADNFAEWNNGHPLGLRTVHAYVLVYDMGNLETFQYCRSIRDQILDSFSHRDFSIIVVGNKYDNVTEAQANSQELKDISTLVRKHWRCGYVECSAQYNYKIGDVFRELMGCSSGGVTGTTSGGLVGTDYSQSTRNKGRCTIL